MHLCLLCVYILFACMHGDHFSVLYCVYTVLQVRHFVSRVAFGDHRAHDNVRVTLFSPFVAFDTALFTLDIFLLNKKNNPGGELPLLLEKVSWCARFSFLNGDCFGCSGLGATG